MGVETAVRRAALRGTRPATGLPAPSLLAPARPTPGPRQAIAFAVLARVVALLDVLIVAAAAAWAAASRPAGWPAGRLAVALAIFVYVTVAALRGLAAWRADRLSRLGPASRTAALASGCGTAALWSAAWLLDDATGPLGWVAWAGVAAAAALVAARGVLALLLTAWQATGRLTRHVAVIGANDYSRSFIETIAGDPGCGLSVVGLYDDRLNRIPASAALPVQGNVGSLVAAARERRIDVVVVALPLSANERIAAIRAQLAPLVADIFLTADTAGLRYDGRDFEALGRNGVIRAGFRPLSDLDAALKGALDRVGAAILLMLLSPLLLTLAVLIRYDSPGPALFRQPRTGFNNRPFAVLKFRTMYRHLTDLHAERQTTRDDVRVTRLGRFLRRSSLDELPQLINVLRGEMSLVGPRPHAANTKAEDRFFDEVVADYALRHRIKPGITGWAQVNGWRGETALIEQLEQRVAHDLSYIENWSVWLDLRILWLTAFRGFGGRAAY